MLTKRVQGVRLLVCGTWRTLDVCVVRLWWGRAARRATICVRSLEGGFVVCAGAGVLVMLLRMTQLVVEDLLEQDDGSRARTRVEEARHHLERGTSATLEAV